MEQQNFEIRCFLFFLPKKVQEKFKGRFATFFEVINREWYANFFTKTKDISVA